MYSEKVSDTIFFMANLEYQFCAFVFTYTDLNGYFVLKQLY